MKRDGVSRGVTAAAGVVSKSADRRVDHDVGDREFSGKGWAERPKESLQALGIR
jgi:hypothetical protein